MKLLVASGVYTVLMFSVFVLLYSGSVWESLLQAVVAGAVFTLLTWLYLRYVSPARSTG